MAVVWKNGATAYKVLESESSPNRGAYVYRIAGGDRWRVRVEKYPDHAEPGSGWWAGRVLWGHDQETSEAALALARRWVDDGDLPETRA